MTPIIGVDAPLGPIINVSVDAAGDVFAVDRGNCLVVKIAPGGTLTLAAGNGICVFSGDGGPPDRAGLVFPTAVAVGHDGSLYVQDNTRLRKVSPAGIITTVATTLNVSSLAIDAAGNVYIAEAGNHRIRMVDSNGNVTTVAGTGSAGDTGDNGPALAAQLNYPLSIAFDPAGNLLVGERDGQRIRKITPAGIITTLVSNLASLDAIAVDPSGGIYYHVATARIYRYVPNGAPLLVAGTGTAGVSGDGGLAVNAQISAFAALAADAAGNVIVGEFSGRIRKISAGGVISRAGGNGGYRFTAGSQTAQNATFDSPSGLALDASGNLYISDLTGGRIRELSGGVVTTIAGTGGAAVGSGLNGNNGDGGPANQASILAPIGLAADNAGSLLIAESGRGAVRKITVDGTISSVAKSFFGLQDVALDPKGNLYFTNADGNVDNSVYRSDQKTAARIAGSSAAGFGGDGGPASQALLNAPSGVVTDAAGNLYISDTGNNRVRRVAADGVIRTFAGNGGTGTSGDGGPALSASIAAPSGLAFDTTGNLFVADTRNSVVRRVAPDGTITTVAGSGNIGFGFGGDGGLATKANLSLTPGSHLAVDAAGTLYIADTGNQRVRAVLASPPSFTATPATLTFHGSSGGALTLPQSIVLAGSITGLPFSITVDTAGTGNWLSVSPSSGATPRLIDVAADPAKLAAGSYSATINIAPGDAIPAKISIGITFTIDAAQPPRLALDRTNLSFAFPAGGAPRSQIVNVSNQGGGALPFTATVTGSGFSVTPVSGTASAGKSVAVNVTANPTGLAAGTYSGTLTISGANGDTVQLPLNLAVSANPKAILLSQSGLAFTAVEQGGIVPPQSFAVLNAGAGTVDFSVSTSTLSGGQQWLMATPSAGVSDPAQAPSTVSVSVNPTGLKAGSYYGQIRVDAPGAANTPQVVTAFLQVLPAGSDVGALIQPAELIFSYAQGQIPSSQNLMIYNSTGTAKTYQVAAAGTGVIMVPGNGAVAPNAPARIVVQPLLSGLPQGTTTIPFTFQFSDGRVRSVRLTFVVTATPRTSTAGLQTAPACTATTLVPALTTLGQQFQVSAGWPVALLADVRDDCGNPLTTGAVSVSFSNGDAPLALQSLKDGRWQGTWQTGSGSKSQVTITLTAANPAAQLNGSRQLIGEFLTQQDPPIVSSSGVVSSAIAVSYVPLAPGGLITVYGSRLADGAQSAQTVPLPTQLGNTTLVMAGQSLPLLYAGPGQVNAQVPFGIAVNTTHQVLIQRGLTYSVPVPVEVAPAQPAIFLAGGAAIVQAYRGTDPPFLVSPQQPVTTGDVIVVYCAGLGVTDQNVPDGGTSPGSPPAQTLSPVTVSIGGQAAPVYFAGLAPGFVGLYQVNSQVPPGVPPGDNVPISLSIAGQISPVATTSVVR
ncbi:MAG TPA: hypothetical protein VEU96_33475 [Bryobacteraceae bacterium]|nr:hypothetical protein [Bryobacteraceae bacterium]